MQAALPQHSKTPIAYFQVIQEAEIASLKNVTLYAPKQDKAQRFSSPVATSVETCETHREETHLVSCRNGQKNFNIGYCFL